MNIRDKFKKKLYKEYRDFQRRTLRGSKRSIYYQGYMVEVIINFYEIMLEKTDTLPESAMHRLMEQPQILMSLYDCWLKKEDSAYEEMKMHVDDEIERSMSLISAERNGYGRKRNTIIKSR